MVRKRLDVSKVLDAGEDAPLQESKPKEKQKYDKISLATTPTQKMQLKQKVKEVDEVSLSQFIIKVLNKHSYSG